MWVFMCTKANSRSHFCSLIESTEAAFTSRTKRAIGEFSAIGSESDWLVLSVNILVNCGRWSAESFWNENLQYFGSNLSKFNRFCPSCLVLEGIQILSVHCHLVAEMSKCHKNVFFLFFFFTRKSVIHYISFKNIY